MKRVLLLLTTLLLLFSCDRFGKKEILKLGTSVEFEPFEYFSDGVGSEIIGLDIEIAKRVAIESKRDLEVVVVDFENLLTSLDEGQIDFAIAAITISDERSLKVDFSIPYYRATQVLIAKKGIDLIQELEDLKYRDVAALVGTTGQNIAEMYTQNVFTFNSVLEMINEVQEERIDYIIMDEQPALKYLEESKDLIVVPIHFDTEYYGIAVKKGNTELLEEINNTLLKMQDDGSYTTLLESFIK